MTKTIFKTIASLFFLSLTSPSLLANPELKKVFGDSYIPRSEWSEHVRDYDTLLKNKKIDLDDGKDVCIINHSVTGSEYYRAKECLPREDELAIVRAIEKLHIEDKKWADIGYHFMISPDGTIYEARAPRFVGAHTFRSNKRSIGIAFLGCYDSVGCPAEGYQVTEVNEDMIQATARLIAHLSKKGCTLGDKETECFPITKETVVSRSVHDTKKFGSTSFPYSPGNLIIAEMDNLLKQASQFRTELDTEEAMGKVADAIEQILKDLKI
ncbi:MAG: N-acetylmuramoyl-L-alanine amidase [Oligoflexales bacterium]|nr:N-acetylmuramoyl-L-alanine amidase [Oligoflexales bacterium]